MDYSQRDPGKNISGIAMVVILHLAIGYALVTGLARKVVEVIKAPIETKIIEEVKPPPPDVPPPPPMISGPILAVLAAAILALIVAGTLARAIREGVRMSWSPGSWRRFEARQTPTLEPLLQPSQARHHALGRPAHVLEVPPVKGLEPPVDLSVIKARYKELAKKHHPDLNPGCDKSEDLLKKINMAYTILKLAYEDFKDLPER